MFESMDSDRILVTGSTGFLGYQLTNHLSRNTKIYAAFRNKNRFFQLPNSQNPNVIPLFMEESRLLDAQYLKEIIVKEKISKVVHCGAICGQKNRFSWQDYYNINVAWSRNLYQAIAEQGVGNKKFIFISTVGIYGTIPLILPATEECPPMPDSDYHKSKAVAEQELNVLHNKYGIPLVVLRPTIMYGDRDFSFVYKLAALIKKGFLPLNRDIYIHLLDVATISEIIETILFSNVQGVFNLGDEKEVSLREFITTLQMVLDKKRIAKFDLVSILDSISFLRPKTKLFTSSWYYSTQKIRNTIQGISLSNTLNKITTYTNWYNYGHNI